MGNQCVKGKQFQALDELKSQNMPEKRAPSLTNATMMALNASQNSTLLDGQVPSAEDMMSKGVVPATKSSEVRDFTFGGSNLVAVPSASRLDAPDACHSIISEEKEEEAGFLSNPVPGKKKKKKKLVKKRVSTKVKKEDSAPDKITKEQSAQFISQVAPQTSHLTANRPAGETFKMPKEIQGYADDTRQSEPADSEESDTDVKVLNRQETSGMDFDQDDDEPKVQFKKVNTRSSSEHHEDDQLNLPPRQRVDTFRTTSNQGAPEDDSGKFQSEDDSVVMGRVAPTSSIGITSAKDTTSNFSSIIMQKGVVTPSEKDEDLSQSSYMVRGTAAPMAFDDGQSDASYMMKVGGNTQIVDDLSSQGSYMVKVGGGNRGFNAPDDMTSEGSYMVKATGGFDDMSSQGSYIVRMGEDEPVKRSPFNRDDQSEMMKVVPEDESEIIRDKQSEGTAFEYPLEAAKLTGMPQGEIEEQSSMSKMASQARIVPQNELGEERRSMVKSSTEMVLKPANF